MHQLFALRTEAQRQIDVLRANAAVLARIHDAWGGGAASVAGAEDRKKASAAWFRYEIARRALG